MLLTDQNLELVAVWAFHNHKGASLRWRADLFPENGAPRPNLCNPNKGYA